MSLRRSSFPRSAVRLDQPQHLTLFWKAAQASLREDQLAVHLDLKDATAALDEFGLDVQRTLELRSQTGCAGQVVSSAAVGDGDGHARPFI